MEIPNWLANFEPINLYGNTTDQYFAEEDEVVQHLYKIWSNPGNPNTDQFFAEEDEVPQPNKVCGNNSNLSDPNIDQYFADEDEVFQLYADEVNLSQLNPEISIPIEQVTTKIEEGLIPESHSCNSISTNDTSSEIRGFIPKYQITSWSDSPVNESLISPGYPSNDKDNDSDYDSYDADFVKKKKEETKKNKKKSTTKSGDYSNTKQNDKKNIPGLITQKVKTATMTNHQFYIRARQRLGLSEEDAEELKKLAKLYNKQHKTWKAIRKFLRRNPRAGKIYLELINLFIAEENREFYKEWLLYGRMKEKTKKILENDKQFFVNKFRVLLSDDDEELEGEKPCKRIKTK